MIHEINAAISAIEMAGKHCELGDPYFWELCSCLDDFPEHHITVVDDYIDSSVSEIVVLHIVEEFLTIEYTLTTNPDERYFSYITSDGLVIPDNYPIPDDIPSWFVEA